MRITRNATPGLTFGVAAEAFDEVDAYGPAVPGFAVLAPFRDAVARGAREALAESDGDLGVAFELIDAFVHEVDTNEWQLQAAGRTAMRGWLLLDRYRG